MILTHKTKGNNNKKLFMFRIFHSRRNPITACASFLPSFPWLTGSASLDETEYFILLKKKINLKKKRNHVLLKDENAVKNI